MEEIAVAVVTPVQVNFIWKAGNHNERLSRPPTLKSRACNHADGTSAFQARLA